LYPKIDVREIKAFEELDYLLNWWLTLDLTCLQWILEMFQKSLVMQNKTCLEHLLYSLYKDDPKILSFYSYKIKSQGYNHKKVHQTNYMK